MSEDTNLEPESAGVSVLDVVVISGVLVIAFALVWRFRKRRLEEQNNFRSLKVVTK